MLKRSRLPMLAIGFAFVLIAAACGGSATATSEPADTEPPIETEVTETQTPATTTTTTTEAPEEEPGHIDDQDGSDHEGEDEESDQDDDDAESDPNDDDSDPVVSDRTVDVIMTDFAFEPNSFTAAAGETVTYIVTNAGVIEHEFRLSNAHRIEEHLADDDHGGDDDGHHGEGIDEVLYLAAGDSGQITVTFPEDTTVFTEVACLIPGHYEAGMFAGLTYDS